MNVTLLDAGIADIKNEINKLIKVAIKKYPKKTKKSEKIASKIPLKIVFKRGPVVMNKNEWCKDSSLAENLTLDPVKVVAALSKKNLNWGILGYGDPKDGLAGLLKYAKTKLNPAQLKGDKQDLKMEINKSGVFEKDGKLQAKIIITVPDKGLQGKDIQNKALEKYGYLGVNAWIEKAKKGLNKQDALDKAILDLLNNEVKLDDLVKVSEETELEDSKYYGSPSRENLEKMVRQLMLELEDTGWLNYNDGPETVKEYLTDKGIEFDPVEVDKIFEEVWYDLFHSGE